jgi:hypothetical protein
MKGQGVNDFIIFFAFIVEFFLNGDGIISIIIRSIFIMKVIPLLKLLSFF